jgi:hypothetical protein
MYMEKLCKRDIDFHAQIQHAWFPVYLVFVIGDIRDKSVVQSTFYSQWERHVILVSDAILTHLLVVF